MRTSLRTAKLTSAEKEQGKQQLTRLKRFMVFSCFMACQAFLAVLVMLARPDWQTPLTFIYLNVRCRCRFLLRF